MSHPHFTRRLGLALSSLCVALLAACGGGGSEPATSIDASQSLANPAAVTTVCGVEPQVTSQESLYTPLNPTMSINGYTVPIALLTSFGGYSYAGVSVDLHLPLEDLRGAAQGYSQQATLDSMGIETNSLFSPGAVGCVAGVSRVIEATSNMGSVNLVSWSSAQYPSLPIDQLGAEAVNGFEYIHNFGSKPATAVFRISKDVLPHPNAASICHVTGASAVDCSTPTITDDGVQWTLRLPVSESGIYLLAATREHVL